MKTLVLKYIDKKNISIITLIIAFLSRIIGGMITNKYLSYLPYINKHSFFIDLIGIFLPLILSTISIMNLKHLNNKKMEFLFTILNIVLLLSIPSIYSDILNLISGLYILYLKNIIFDNRLFHII